MLKNLISAIGLCTVILVPQASVAGSYSDALGNCLVQETNDVDRSVLMQWIVIAYAHSSKTADVVTANPGALEDISPRIADLLTRLLTEDCKTEATSAFNNEGQASFQLAFQTLGIVAGREAATDPGVTTALTAFLPYVDTEKIGALLVR